MHREGVEQWVRTGLLAGIEDAVIRKYRWLVNYYNRSLSGMFPAGGYEDDLIDESIFAVVDNA